MRPRFPPTAPRGGASVVVYIPNGTVWNQAKFVEIFEKNQQVGYRCLAESPAGTRFASYFWKFWSPVGATFGPAFVLCEIYVSVGIPSFPSPNSFRERAPLFGHLWHSARFTTSARPLLRAHRASVNGARPLWHSARFPDPTFSKSPDFLATTIGPKVSQESIWQGPVASFRVLSRFRKIAAAAFPPAEPFAKEGRHMRSRFCTLPDLRLQECSFSPIYAFSWGR